MMSFRSAHPARINFKWDPFNLDPLPWLFNNETKQIKSVVEAMAEWGGGEGGGRRVSWPWCLWQRLEKGMELTTWHCKYMTYHSSESIVSRAHHYLNTQRICIQRSIWNLKVTTSITVLLLFSVICTTLVFYVEDVSLVSA